MADIFPKLRDDLIISRQEQAGQIVFIIKDPYSGRFFRLREPEYFLASALDGQTPPEEILAAFKNRFRLEISPEQFHQFIAGLEEKQFLESALTEYALSRHAEKRPERSLIEKILYVKLSAFDPHNFIEWLYEHFRFLLTPPFIFISALVIVVGLLQIKASSAAFSFNLYQIFGLSSILVIIIALFLVIAGHELAHSLVCRHFGGRVSEMGFLLLYFQICFYCNLSDSYLFERKRDKLLTILAGIYFQALLGSSALLLWRIIKTGNPISDLLFLIASISMITLLFNLNPLLKLDGYYLLTDLVEIPNLRSRAFRYLGKVLRRTFLYPDGKREKNTPREKTINIIYSILALAYSLFLFYIVGAFLYKLLTEKWGGGGFLLFLALLGVIFSGPIRKTIGSIGRIFSGQGVSVPRSKRFYFWLTSLAILILLAFLVPVDLKINAPLSIEPLEKFVIKEGSANLLETLWFRGGNEQKPVSHIYQFRISDYAVVDVRPTLTPGTKVDSGEILLQMSSGYFISQLDQTNAEIAKANADYELLLSDPKAAELSRAKATLEEAKLKQIKLESEYERAGKLHELKLISDQEWQAYITSRNVQDKQIEIAQSEFDLLREGPKAQQLLAQDAEIRRLTSGADYLKERIESCIIKAPFSGVLTRFGIEGEMISLSRTDSVEVIIRVPEDQVDILRVGRKLKFRVAGYPQASFYGQVIKIISEAQEGRDGSHFEAIGIVPNPEGLLKGGLTGYAKIYCGKTSVIGNLLRKFMRFFRVEFWSWW